MNRYEPTEAQGIFGRTTADLLPQRAYLNHRAGGIGYPGNLRVKLYQRTMPLLALAEALLCLAQVGHIRNRCNQNKFAVW